MFVTPVTIVEGQRPDPGLRLAPDQFVALVHDLHELAADLSDVWIEVGMFSVEYADYVAGSGQEYWNRLAPEGNALTWEDHITATSSGFCLRYYPISLTGTRELIVNTNGDVLVPQSMARGKIESDAVVGSLLKEGIQSLLQRLPSTQAFSFYQRELIRESQILRRYF